MYPPGFERTIGHDVSLDHCDGPQVIGQRPRGKQPAHGLAQNDRTLNLWSHILDPRSFREETLNMRFQYLALRRGSG